MRNKMIAVCKLLAISSLSLALMNCATNDYDDISARDKRSVNYSAKVLFPTKNRRLDIIAERQGTRAETATENPAVVEIDFIDVPQGTFVTNEIRPVVTTRNNFKINADSLGLKWNFLDERYFGMNLYFSAMHLSTNIDIAIPAYLNNAPSQQHISLNDNIFSPKFEVYVPLTKRLNVSASISYAGILDDDSLYMLDASASYFLTEHLSVGLGAKYWEYSLGDDAATDGSLERDKFNFSAHSHIYLRSGGVLGQLSYKF